MKLPLSKTKPLTWKEERALLTRYWAGDTAVRRILVERNTRFLFTVARGYIGRGLELEDLVQEGAVGLLVALDRFDPTREWRFLSYAVWWVRQAMLKAVKEGGLAIRVPANFSEKPRPGESQEVKAEKLRRREFLEAVTHPTRLDVLADAIEFNLEDPHPLADETMDERRTATWATELLDTLPERERAILLHRFGFYGPSPTLREIGEDVGLSHERVRQLMEKGMKRLRTQAKRDRLTHETAPAGRREHERKT